MFNAGKQSLLTSAAICLLLTAVFVLRFLVAPYDFEAAFTGGMPIARALTEFSVKIPWLAVLISLGLVAWTLFYIVELTGKYSPTARRNYIPPQIFLIAAGGIAISDEALAAFLAAFILTVALRQFIFSLGKDFRFSEVFRAGFYLGLIPLIYAPFAAASVVLVSAGLVIYKRSAREWTVALAGLVFPFLAAMGVYWAVGEQSFTQEFVRCITLSYSQIELSVPQIAIGAMVILLGLAGVVWSVGHRKSARKKQYLFVLHLSLLIVLLSASALIPAGRTFTVAALSAVPLSLVVPHAFVGKWWGVVSSMLYFFVLAAVFLSDLLISLL